MSEAHAYLMRQFGTAWKLAQVHLATLSTEECLWRPAARGPHVTLEQGRWRADWPEDESYEAGPPSIAWLTWHIGFWWSMVLNHSFGDERTSRESIDWPGEADAVRRWLSGLERDWRARIEPLSATDLASDRLSRWPVAGRPFGETMAWVNLELAKNAAEIGYARFLYAARGE